MTSSIVSNNTAHKGGGLYINSGDVTSTDGTLTDNNATLEPSGVDPLDPGRGGGAVNNVGVGTFNAYGTTVMRNNRQGGQLNDIGGYGAKCSFCASSCTAGEYGACFSVIGAPSCSTGCSCNKCPPGTSLAEAGSTLRSDCEPCSAGTTSTAGASACSACVAGKYTSSSESDNSGGLLTQVLLGATTCNSCPAGYQSAGAAVVCLACSAGSSSSPGDEACTPCGVGQYSTGGSDCFPCERGFFSASNGSSSCTACEAGTTTANASSTACTPCAIGKYQGGTGQSECFDCAAGFFSAANGSTSCTACEAGTTTTNTSSTACAPCAIGKFQGGTGQSACLNCDKGKAVAIKRSTSCASCSSGKHALSSGMEVCTSCPAGTFSGPQASECQQCLAGTLSATAGSSSCDECSGNTYSMAGSGVCDRCLRFYYRSLQGTCEPCTKGSLCPTDGASTQELLRIDKDVWRISAMAVILHSCPFPGACTGGTVFVEGYCDIGFEGPLCAVCSEGFYFNSDVQGCDECEDGVGPNLGSGTLVVLILFLIVCLFALVFVWWSCGGYKKANELRIIANESSSKLQKLKNDIMKRVNVDEDAANWIHEATANGSFSVVRQLKEEPKVTTKEFSVEVNTSVAKTVTTVVVKTTVSRETEEIVIVPSSPTFLFRNIIKKHKNKFKASVAYCQIVVSISFNCVINFPSLFEKILRGLEIFNLNILPELGLQCISRFDYLDQLLFMTLSPLFLGLVLLIVYAVNARTKHTVFTLGLLLSFLVLVGISSHIIHLFKCDQFDEAEDGKEKAWLFKDYSVDCMGARYQGFIAYACFMILVYPIGIPFIYATLIWHHRELLSDPEAMRHEIASGYPTVGHLKFLVQSYSARYFYFEVVECARRLLLTSIIGIVAPDSAVAPVLGLLIAIVFVIMFAGTTPFKDEIDNRFAVALSFSLSLFFLAALMIKADLTSDDQDDQRFFGWVLTAILTGGPLLVVCENVWLYIESQRENKTHEKEEESGVSQEPSEASVTATSSPEFSLEAATSSSEVLPGSDRAIMHDMIDAMDEEGLLGSLVDFDPSGDGDDDDGDFFNIFGDFMMNPSDGDVDDGDDDDDKLPQQEQRTAVPSSPNPRSDKSRTSVARHPHRYLAEL